MSTGISIINNFKLSKILLILPFLMVSIVISYLSVHNLILLVVFVGSIISIGLAYFYPTITLFALLFIGQIVQYELSKILEGFTALSLSNLNFRFSDPILFGIIVSLTLKLMQGRHNVKELILGKGKFFVLFFIYVLIEVIRNVGIYGTFALGEFRTYYGGFVVLNYVAINTGTIIERKKIFKLIMYLGLGQIIVALIKGAYIQGFSLNAYEKWLSAFGSLALLYALFAFYLYNKYVKINISKTMAVIIFLSGILVLIIASNRSVWLAGSVGILLLIILKEIKLKEQIIFLIIGAIVLFIAMQLFFFEGYNFYNFFGKRLLAFTNYESDETSIWRYYVWSSLLESVYKNIFFGFGLGDNFQIFVPELNTILYNSPHNFYLAMLYQLGIVGIFLILLLFVSFINQLTKLKNLIDTDLVIKKTVYVVIVCLLIYWLAYSTEKDLFTWCFLGLGFSLIINKNFK